MRNGWQLGTAGIVAVALVVAVACGGGGGGNSGGGGGGGGSGGGGTAVVVTRTPTPTVDNSIAEAAESASATIEPLNGSAVGGTATAVKSGGGSEVTVDATGLTPGAHSVYLKNGGCEGAGQRVGPLTEINAGADGAGSSTTPLPASRLAQLLISRSHVVIYEGGQAGQGAVVGCGELVAD